MPAARAVHGARREPVRLLFRFYGVSQSDEGLRWGYFPRSIPLRPEREVSAGRFNSLAVQADLFMIPVGGVMGKCGIALAGVVQLEEGVERSEERELIAVWLAPEGYDRLSPFWSARG